MRAGRQGKSAHRDMTSANGVISEPYVHGIVYCTGNAVYGHPCVSPILDLTNSTGQDMVVYYASRASGLHLDEASRVFLAPSSKTLITGMLPGNSGGLGGAVSYLAVSTNSSTGPFDLYALVFSPGAGFQLVPAPGSFGVVGAAVTQVGAANSCATPTVGVFPLQFKGCAAPNWQPWNLVYTASFGAACNNKGAPAPCAALGTWALATA